MSRLTDVGIGTGDAVPPRSEAVASLESDEIDRSPTAVLREIAASLAGWLFFVVGIQLLLYGSHLI